MFIDRLNDTNTTANGGYGINAGAYTSIGQPNTGADRYQNQLSRVVAVSGTSVTIDPPIEMANYNSASVPQVWWESANPMEMAGVEDLTVHSTVNWSHGVAMRNAYSCWVKNVKVTNTRYAISTGISVACEIRHCWVSGLSGSNDDYMYNIFWAGGCLFEDNIADNGNTSFLIETSSGNAFTYNYTTNNNSGAGWMVASMSWHGGHPSMNLVEGNVTSGVSMDNGWGSSIMQTHFRNRITGVDESQPTVSNYVQAIADDSMNRFQNIVGNVLGTTGKNTVYQAGATANNNVYLMGMSIAGVSPSPDPVVAATVIRAVNWDSANNGIVSGGYTTNDLPASLLYDSKPAFFGNLQWPPIDPGSVAYSMSRTNIPAGYRFVNGVDPGSNTNPPAILAQPTSQTNMVFTTATFSVTATNAASYQWSVFGTNYPGATSATWTTPALPLSWNGAPVFVTMANGTFGVTNSATVTLTVTNGPLPTISGQPVNASVLVGNTASFAVTAAGATSYQWLMAGTNVTGATAAAWTTPVYPIGTNSVQVQCINQYGTTASIAVFLAVTNGALSITAQPQSVTVGAFSNATFTVTATGNPTITYQWRFAGTNIGGATAASYTRTNCMPAVAGSYQVVVSNPYLSVTSAVATLTITNAIAPSISVQPQSTTVTAGQDATFSVTASGTAPLAYQWRLGGVNIVGATASTYTKSGTVLGDSGGSYTVVVTNSFGSITSAAAVLTVSAGGVAPQIILQPLSKTANVGDTIIFAAQATGDAPMSYQWQFNGANIPGATGMTVSIAPVVVGSGGNYRVVVTNPYGSATSSPALLTVINALATPPPPQTLYLVY